MSTGYFPACPSVSGGFACHELVLSDERPTVDNTIGLAPPPPPGPVCTFSDDFPDPDSESPPYPRLADRPGWYAQWPQAQGWYLYKNQARYGNQGHSHTCSHDLDPRCGTDLVVQADMKPCTGKYEHLKLLICGTPELPTGWGIEVEYLNRTYLEPAHHAVTLFFQAIELDEIHLYESPGFHHYALIKVGPNAIVTRDNIRILSGHAEDVPGAYINSIHCRATQSYGAFVDNYELYAV